MQKAHNSVSRGFYSMAIVLSLFLPSPEAGAQGCCQTDTGCIATNSQQECERLGGQFFQLAVCSMGPANPPYQRARLARK